MSNTTHAKVVIIGSGPAGYTASIYAARAMLEPILIQGYQPGGQLTITTDVENYPGFLRRDPGPLAHGADAEAGRACRHPHRHRSRQQSRYLQPPVPPDLRFRRCLSRRCGDPLPPARRRNGSGCRSRSKFKGYGVSACATCDGFFYRGKEVIVVGGGNTAVEEALFLTNFANKVTLVHRRDTLRAERILQERLFKNPKIEVLWDTVVDDLIGSESPSKVTAAKLRNVKTGALSERNVDGVFIAIGHTPATELVQGKVEMKPSGYVATKPHSTATSVPGLFAAGDVTDDIYRQAVTAAGQGCMAALEAERFLAVHEQLRTAAE